MPLDGTDCNAVGDLRARREKLGLTIDAMSRIACVRKDSLGAVERGQGQGNKDSGGKGTIIIARLLAALAVLEVGGSAPEACAAALAAIPGGASRGRGRPVITADIDNRVCLAAGCNNMLVRKYDASGRLEPLKRWIARRYCCRDCVNDSMAEIMAANVFDRMAGANEGWPETTGSTLTGQCFAAHNLNIPSGPAIRHNRPETHVDTLIGAYSSPGFSDG